MNKKKLIRNTVEYVKKKLNDNEKGHDWWHIQRVWNNAKYIAKYEDCNMLVVELGALLHDIADSKFYNGDETVGPQTARNFLKSENVDELTISEVVNIIEKISFKGNVSKQQNLSEELKVVMDADRLDALGAIGIARTFNYGGFMNREIYNPLKPYRKNMTKEEYKNNKGSSVNHFYEKLLLLKDLMNTKIGKKLAEERHRFMNQYLEQFYKEWNLK